MEYVSIMKLRLEPKEAVWKKRGNQPKRIPAEVQKMADDTYRTGHVGVIDLDADDEEDAVELVSLLKSYAKSRGLRMRIQRDDDQLRYEMADRLSAAEEAA